MTRPKVNRSQRRLQTTAGRRRYNRQQAARRNLFPDPTNNGDVDDAVRPLLPNEPRPHSPDFDIDIEAVVNPHNPILLQQQPVVPAEQQADEWENHDYFQNFINNIDGVGGEDNLHNNIRHQQQPVAPDQRQPDQWENHDLFQNLVPQPQPLTDPQFLDLRQTFINKLNNIQQLTCQFCQETSFITVDQAHRTCSKCTSEPRRQKFSAENNMDPGPTVPELVGLTPVEQMLIAQVNPNMTLMRLPRGGQYAFRGHVLNVPQDVNAFVTNLPRRVNQLEILVLKKQGANPDLPPTYFTVNRQRVLDALVWLKNNNPYYHHINIDHVNLQALPEHDVIRIPDENIVDEMNVHNDQQQAPHDPNPHNPPQPNHNPLIPNTFAPVQRPGPNERAAIQAAIANDQVLEFPRRGNDPINEFNTEGYIAKAFPWLFPTGRADFKAPRQTSVTAQDYFMHMLRYFDGRFQSDPRFVFLAYNSVLRWKALQTGAVFARNNPQLAQITAHDITQMLQQDRRDLSNKILRFGSSLRGTPQYWFAQRKNLLSMIDQLGNASVFFTFSVADQHWPDLRRFLNLENRNVYEAISYSPLTVDSYVMLRFETFFNHFLTPYLGIDDYWYSIEWQHRGSLHVHGLAWLTDFPNSLIATEQQIAQYWDRYVNSWNPAIQPDDNPVNFFWHVDLQAHPC